MPTLQIEHPISDLAVWQAAFDRFADARAQAGVQSHRVRQPVDDARYVVVDLEFGTREEALRFREFLHAVVWASPESSPALVGTPQTRVLDTAPV